MEKILLKDVLKEIDTITSRLNNKVNLDYSMPSFIAFKEDDKDLIAGITETDEFEKTSKEDWESITTDLKRYTKLSMAVTRAYDSIIDVVPILTLDGAYATEMMSINRAIAMKSWIKRNYMRIFNNIHMKYCIDMGMRPINKHVITVDPNNIIGSNIINDHNALVIDIITKIDRIIRKVNTTNYVYL